MSVFIKGFVYWLAIRAVCLQHRNFRVGLICCCGLASFRVELKNINLVTETSFTQNNVIDQGHLKLYFVFWH